METAESLNARLPDTLPGKLGVTVTHTQRESLTAEIAVQAMHMAANGYLHAGTAVTLADTCAGLGCISHLPDGAVGFTTIELKSNHTGTAPGPDHAGVGCGGDAQGDRKTDCVVPVHADGAV